jgi:hypothetical protein
MAWAGEPISSASPSGWLLSVEIKVPGKQHRPEQETWARMVRSLGGM